MVNEIVLWKPLLLQDTGGLQSRDHVASSLQSVTAVRLCSVNLGVVQEVHCSCSPWAEGPQGEVFSLPIFP